MISLPEAAPSKERQTLMDEDIPLPFELPAVERKKVSAAFDGGRISSDGGVMLLAQADRRLGIAERLDRAIPDGRDPDRVTHPLPDILHGSSAGDGGAFLSPRRGRPALSERQPSFRH